MIKVGDPVTYEDIYGETVTGAIEELIPYEECSWIFRQQFRKGEKYCATISHPTRPGKYSGYVSGDTVRVSL